MGEGAAEREKGWGVAGVGVAGDEATARGEGGGGGEEGKEGEARVRSARVDEGESGCAALSTAGGSTSVPRE